MEKEHCFETNMAIPYLLFDKNLTTRVENLVKEKYLNSIISAGKIIKIKNCQCEFVISNATSLLHAKINLVCIVKCPYINQCVYAQVCLVFARGILVDYDEFKILIKHDSLAKNDFGAFVLNSKQIQCGNQIPIKIQNVIVINNTIKTIAKIISS